MPENIIQQIINKQILNFKPSTPSPPQPPFPFQTPSPPQTPSPLQAIPTSVISSSQQIQIGNFINDWLSMSQTGQGKTGSNMSQTVQGKAGGNMSQTGQGKAGGNTVQTVQENAGGNTVQTGQGKAGGNMSQTGQTGQIGQEKIEIEFIHDLEHKYEYKNIVDTLIIKPKKFIFILLSVIFIILVLLLPNMFIYDDNKSVNNTKMVF